MSSRDDISQVDRAVGWALAGGLIEPGQARRVRLAARLAGALDAADGRPRATSGMSLAGDLGISRAAVHKHIVQLHNLGFDVSAVPGKGYRLESPFSDLVVGEAVLPLLLGALARPTGCAGSVPDVDDAACPLPGALFAGLPYHYEHRSESTNLYLKTAASAGSGAGVIAVTDHQIGGRGRLGRRWISEPGKDLTFSVLLRPDLAPGQARLLSLAAAVAVAEVLETLSGTAPAPGAAQAGPTVAVKWPNDVLLGSRKVCGILLEGSMDADRLNWAVAGLGLNVNGAPGTALEASGEDRSGRPEPVSLREALGREVPRGWLLARLLERLTLRWGELETGIPAPGGADLMTALRERDALAGSQVIVRSGSRGREVVAAGIAMGIGREGELLVREPSGSLKAVIAGEVTLAQGL